MDTDLTGRRRDRDDLEARLRAALESRADEATPSHRLDLILDEAAAVRPSRSGATRWTVVLVAAALVTALAIALSGLLGSTPGAAPLEPGGPTATGSPDPVVTDTAGPEPTSTAPVETSSPSSPEPTDAPVETDLAALPVYFAAHIGEDLRMIRLYREWLNVEGVTRDAPVSTKLPEAVRLALGGEAPGTDGYLHGWEGVSLVDAQRGPDSITVTLSGPGDPDLDEEWARISVQQLVWTAQAVVGEGTIPVRFEVADGSRELFGRFPTDRTYNRPASSDLYYEDLAPIWILSPVRGAVVDGSDVVVTGEATVFEGAFQWELIDGSSGAVLSSGFGQASAGGPARGTYEIPLGDLAPGEYAIRVYELSMADGTTVSAEQTIGFSVR